MSETTRNLARKILEVNGIKGLEALAKEEAMTKYVEESIRKISEAHNTYTYFEKVSMTPRTKAKMIEVFFNAYMNQEEHTEEFAKEFFYVVGHLLKEEIPSYLKHINVNDITVSINELLAGQINEEPEVKRQPIQLTPQQQVELKELEDYGFLDVIAERNVLRVKVQAYEKKLEELGLI